MRKAFSSFVLVALVCALGGIAYSRGLFIHLGAAPAVLNGPYSTEEAWVVNEIVRDITEMSAYPGPSSAPVVTPGEQEGRYRVAMPRESVELDLRDDVWSPSRFGALARAALSDRAQSTGTDADDPVYMSLLEFTPAALARASDSASRALTANMRNARAHEAAALTLGAFALRETAGRFSDTRWALNRMTAHLAMSSAVAESTGPDGRLAHAVLLTLLNRQVLALDALDRIALEDRSPEAEAWVRALRLRITQDWRRTRAPELETPLEQKEYFRARRATVSTSLARVELVRLHAEPAADWIRLVENSSVGVEDGWLMTQALEFERAEYAGVYRRLRGREIGRDPSDDLNSRAGRCIGSDGPRVIPWGAWAEFAQRHLALFMDKNDRFYRHQLGDAESADGQKRRMEFELGKLTMFPLATIFWTRGARGGDADLTYINQAIAAAIQSPDRVVPGVWSFLEQGSKYEPVARGLPLPATWFMAASLRVPQNASARLKDTGHPHGLDLTAALMKLAPYDYGLSNEYLTTKYGQKTPYAEARAAYGPRVDYDVRVLRAAHGFATDDAQRLAVLRISCDVAASECIPLGAHFVKMKQEREAAVAYERALGDESVDAVRMAASSGWLVEYYRRSDKTDRALALAERSAATGSWQGLVTAASLYEKLGRFEDAEKSFREAADRYENPSQLLGFYYRDINDRKQSRYKDAWNEAIGRVFPSGLVPTTAGNAKPTSGVVFMSDNILVKEAGLLIGDIVVGLEGWRVDSFDQYRTVNAFFEREEMKLTVWRGGRLLPITVTAPKRLMGVEFRTYPIQGWRDK
jgi:hypothetical protein